MPSVVIPVKAFHRAKLRLAPAMSSAARAAMARELADSVVSAADGFPVLVPCDDREVAEWAESRGATVVWSPGRGLNGAVRDGVGAVRMGRGGSVVVAHADLPHARHLATVADFVGVTVVPDQRRDGTPVLALPSSLPFEFAYGSGSFRRHVAEGRRRGVAVRVLNDRALGWDIDMPTDLTGSQAGAAIPAVSPVAAAPAP